MKEYLDALVLLLLVGTLVGLAWGIGFAWRAITDALRASFVKGREARRKERVLGEVSRACFSERPHPAGCICLEHRERRRR